MKEKHGVDLTLEDIAKEVWVIGKPRRHPCTSTVEKWQSVFAEDPNWYPGKAVDERKGTGRKRKFTDHMRLCVKKSAESLKIKENKEPTVNEVRRRCPSATVNPDTGEYFDKKLILDVFRNDCYDVGAKLPWGHLPPIAQTALAPPQIKLRRQYAVADQQDRV